MIIDAHAHCGIIDQSMPQSFEDYSFHIQNTGIEAVVMFSPVMEIYDRHRPNFKDTVDWQRRREKSNQYLLTVGGSDLEVIPYFFIWNDFAVDQIKPQQKGIKWHRHPQEPVYHYEDPKCKEGLTGHVRVSSIMLWSAQYPIRKNHAPDSGKMAVGQMGEIWKISTLADPSVINLLMQTK